MSWHWFFNDVSVFYIKDALNWGTAQFVNNPAYAPLHLKGIIIDEMTSSIAHYQPAYYLEKGNAVGAADACWYALDGNGTSNCYNNTIDALLTTETKQPRAVWWVAKCYSETVKNRVVPTSISPEIISFSATNTFSHNEANLLIANYACVRFTPDLNVNVQLNNLGAVAFINNADSIQITVYKIPNDSVTAITSLPLVGRQYFIYTGQNVSFPLPALGIKEAHWLSISKGNVSTPIDEAVKDINKPSCICY